MHQASFGFIGLADEGVSLPAQIYATGSGGTYLWRWVASDGTEASRGGFTFFYDCLADARAHGYEPHLRNPEESGETVELVLDPVAPSAPLAEERRHPPAPHAAP